MGVQHRVPRGTHSQAWCFPAQWLACPGPSPAWCSGRVHLQLALREHTWEESGAGWEEARNKPNSELPRWGRSFWAQKWCNRKYLDSFSGTHVHCLLQICLRSHLYQSTSLVSSGNTAPSHMSPGYRGNPSPFCAQKPPPMELTIHTRPCRAWACTESLGPGFPSFS